MSEVSQAKLMGMIDRITQKEQKNQKSPLKGSTISPRNAFVYVMRVITCDILIVVKADDERSTMSTSTTSSLVDKRKATLNFN